MDSITVEIAKLSLVPGDMLAVMVDRVLPHESRQHIVEYVKSALPQGVGVVVFDGGMTLQAFTSMPGNVRAPKAWPDPPGAGEKSEAYPR